MLGQCNISFFLTPDSPADNPMHATAQVIPPCKRLCTLPNTNYWTCSDLQPGRIVKITSSVMTVRCRLSTIFVLLTCSMDI